MKYLLSCFILFFTLLPATAQLKWFDPLKCGFPVIQNQGFTSEIGYSYQRLPDRAQAVVRKQVWNLSKESAGLSIRFFCNASQIKIRYQVTGGFSMPHMPATGVSGVDLYRVEDDHTWDFCFGNYAFADTVVYSYNHIAKNTSQEKGFEYRLFLPLYNGVKWLEIGVSEGSELEFIPASHENSIVVYGTSIAQGACASRPGMAWTNILHRSLNRPVINLGFSGNGKLEENVLDFINELNTSLFILDCMPNFTEDEEDIIYTHVVNAVKQIRSKHKTPILLVEHAGYSNAKTDATQLEGYAHTNRASRRAFETLLAEGVSVVFYISHNELGFDPDAWVDSTHPSDVGMQRQAKVLEKAIRDILHGDNSK